MTVEPKVFDFLTDGVIDLVLEKKKPADPSKGHVPEYDYRVALHGSREKVGEIRLRVGNVPALLTAGHIGYEIVEAHRGHHYAARACRLVGLVARAHGLSPVIITCDPDNTASRRTCERIGATFRGVYDVPVDHEMYQKGVRRVSRYEWTVPQDSSGRSGLV